MTQFTSAGHPAQTKSLTHDTPERSHPDLRPWVYSWSGFDQEWTGPFPTDQAAATAALAETDPGHPRWEGVRLHLGRADHPLPSSFLDTERLLSHLSLEACTEYGGHAFEWLADVTPDQQGDLERQLAQILDDWAALHGHLPRCYEVSDVQALPFTAAQALAVSGTHF